MSRSKLFSKNSKRTGNRSHGCRCSCICLPAAESNRYFHLLERHPYLCSLFVCLLLNALYFGGEGISGTKRCASGNAGSAGGGSSSLVAAGAVSAPEETGSGLRQCGVYAAGADWGVVLSRSQTLRTVGAGRRLCCAKRAVLAHPKAVPQPAAAGFAAPAGDKLSAEIFLRVLHAHYPTAARCGKIRGRRQPRRLHHLSVAALPAAGF